MIMWTIFIFLMMAVIWACVDVYNNPLTEEEKIKRLKRRLKWELRDYKDESEKQFWNKLFDIISNTPGSKIDIKRDCGGNAEKYDFGSIVIIPLWPTYPLDNSFTVKIKKGDIAIYTKYKHKELCEIIMNLIYVKVKTFLDEWSNEQTIKLNKEYKENIDKANKIL